MSKTTLEPLSSTELPQDASESGRWANDPQLYGVDSHGERLAQFVESLE